MPFYEGAMKTGAVIAACVTCYTGSSALLGYAGNPSVSPQPQAEATELYSAPDSERNIAIVALLLTAALAGSGAAIRHEQEKAAAC